MAALANDAQVSQLGSSAVKITLPCVKADTFYSGAVVWLDVSGDTGQVQVDSIAAGDRIAGICAKQQTTTAAADEVEIYVGGIWEMPCAAGVTATDVGYWLVHDIGATQTDNPADLVASVDASNGLEANDACMGLILGLPSTARVIVNCGVLQGSIYSATLGWV